MVTGLPWEWPDAACRGADPDDFYPETGRSPKQAVAVCLSLCPRLAECREWALSTAELWGVWGGMTEAQRRRVLNKGKGQA